MSWPNICEFFGLRMVPLKCSPTDHHRPCPWSDCTPAPFSCTASIHARHTTLQLASPAHLTSITPRKTCTHCVHTQPENMGRYRLHTVCWTGSRTDSECLPRSSCQSIPVSCELLFQVGDASSCLLGFCQLHLQLELPSFLCAERLLGIVPGLHMPFASAAVRTVTRG